MKKVLSQMSPTDDPSIFEHEGSLYHVPGGFGIKLAYVLMGFLLLALGVWFCWEPAGRLLFGQSAEARVIKIVKVTPGMEDITFRYRHEFPGERDRSISFQHFVSVPTAQGEKTLRLGVDSRVKPYANVNDRMRVAFFPNDTYAFNVWQIRSWGIGILYAVIGLAFVGMGIPMLVAVGKPILIDPEAPSESQEDPSAKP